MFTGVSGFGLGMNGLQCVGFSEWDKSASNVLRYHFPDIKNYGDCSTINWNDVPDFDILTGGSPCQDFSVAGKRAGLKGSRSSLAWEFIRGLREKKPAYFIWENVEGALSSRKGWDLANIVCAFLESGYALSYQVHNAFNFAAPQNRKRIFIIGTRGKRAKEIFFEHQDGENGYARNKEGPGREVGTTLSVRSAGGGNARGNYVLYNGGSIWNRIYNPEEGPSVSIKANGGGGGAKTGLYAIKRKGDDYVKQKDIANCLDANYFKGIDAHQARTGVSDGIRIRRLTPKECERCMTWPDDWTKYGRRPNGRIYEMSDTQRYKMCGNGVVSNVVKEIVKALI